MKNPFNATLDFLKMIISGIIGFFGFIIDAVKSAKIGQRMDSLSKETSKSFSFRVIVTLVLLAFLGLSFFTSITILKVFSVFILLLWLVSITKKIANWIFLGVIFLILSLSSVELSKSAVIIHSFIVPQKFTDAFAGYSGDVIANHLYDEISGIGRQIEINDQKFNLLNNQPQKDTYDFNINSSSAIPEFYFQELGISLNSFYQYIKRSGYFKNIFHYKYFIVDGDVIAGNNKNWELTVRVMEDNMKIERKFLWDDGKGLKNIAEFILENIDLKKLAKYYYYQGKIDTIVSTCTNILTWNNSDAEAHYMLGLAYSFKNDLELAVGEYQNAILLKPDYADAHYNLGYSYSILGQTNYALQEYQNSLKYKPGDSRTLNNLGSLYLRQGRQDLAIRQYKKALNYNPHDIYSYNNLANYYLAKQNLPQALKIMKNSIQNNPDNYILHYQLGNVYQLMHNYASAEQEYLTSIRINPSNPLLRFYLGNFYLTQNRLDNSIAEYQTALKFRQDLSVVYLNLSKAYELKGLRVLAMQTLIEMLKYTGSDKEQSEQIRQKIKDLSHI